MSFDTGAAASSSSASSGSGGMASSIGSAIGQAGAAYISSNAAKSTLQFQARMADINARIAQLGVESVLRQGHSEVAKYTRQVGQVKGRQRASLAANGVTLDTGNAVEIQAGTDMIKDLDVAQITANASRTAFGYRMSASNSQIASLAASGSASAISPGMAAGASLLGSMGGVAEKWYASRGAMDNSPSNYSGPSSNDTEYY